MYSPNSPKPQMRCYRATCQRQTGTLSDVHVAGPYGNFPCLPALTSSLHRSPRTLLWVSKAACFTSFPGSWLTIWSAKSTRWQSMCWLVTVNTMQCSSVASTGFVVRSGKAGNEVMGHSRRTSGPGAAAARRLIILWLMQYWSKELRVVDTCISWSRRLYTQYLDSWLSADFL